MRCLSAFCAIALIFVTWCKVDAAFVTEVLKFDGSINNVKFVNYESVFRFQNSVWTEIDISTNDPAAALDPSSSSSLKVGDVFVQVLRAVEINGTSSFTGEMTAYAVLEVASIVLSSNFPNPSSSAEIVFKSSLTNGDPFNVLSGNQALAIYVDATPDFTSNSGKPSDVSNATDGSLFAVFGFGNAVDAGIGGVSVNQTYAYTSVTIDSGGIASFNFRGWFNVLQVGPSFSGVVFPGVSEGIRKSSIFASATLTTPHTPQDVSGWDVESNDPARFRVVPEPTSLAALLGTSVMGTFWFTRRRQRG